MTIVEKGQRFKVRPQTFQSMRKRILQCCVSDNNEIQQAMSTVSVLQWCVRDKPSPVINHRCISLWPASQSMEATKIAVKPEMFVPYSFHRNAIS